MATATVTTTQTAHRQMRRGENFYDKKDWEKAAEAFRQAEENPDADFNSGNVAYRQNRFDEAAKFFEKAAGKTRNPTEKSDAFFNLGNALLQNGQLKEAEKAFENSLRHSPNRPDAQKNLQITKRKLNEKEPPPPPPPPKRPPPPLANPQRRYLDRAQNPPAPETIAGGLSPEQARKLLENIVVPDEQKNMRVYRSLAPPGTAERGKKDW